MIDDIHILKTPLLTILHYIQKKKIITESEGCYLYLHILCKHGRHCLNSLQMVDNAADDEELPVDSWLRKVERKVFVIYFSVCLLKLRLQRRVESVGIGSTELDSRRWDGETLRGQSRAGEQLGDRWDWCVWAFLLRCHSGATWLVIWREGPGQVQSNICFAKWMRNRERLEVMKRAHRAHTHTHTRDTLLALLTTLVVLVNFPWNDNENSLVK